MVAAALVELCAEPEQIEKKKRSAREMEEKERMPALGQLSKAEEALSTGYLHPAQASPAGTKQQAVPDLFFPQ